MALVTKNIIYSVGDNHDCLDVPEHRKLVYGEVKAKWSMNRARQDYYLHGITITDRMGDSIHIGDSQALKHLAKALEEMVEADDRVMQQGWAPMESTVVD